MFIPFIRVKTAKVTTVYTQMPVALNRTQVAPFEFAWLDSACVYTEALITPDRITPQ